MNPRLTPAQVKKKVDQEKARLDKLARLKRDYNEVFSTAAGKAVLRDIINMSGMFRSDVVAHPENGQIHLKSSLYNMAFRNFYLKIRSRLKPEVLRDVEVSHVVEESVEADIFE